MVVSWFSAGVSSAVATKLMIKDIDKIIYTHIDDQHPDTMRFVKDCEKWFGKHVEVLQSLYKSVENACLKAGGSGKRTRLSRKKNRLKIKPDGERIRLCED